MRNICVKVIVNFIHVLCTKSKKSKKKSKKSKNSKKKDAVKGLGFKT